MALDRRALREWTPLYAAAESGDVDEVRELLEGGKYDVNCTYLGGRTPLHVAAAKGHLGVVKVLASEFKADVGACTDSGETPMSMAANKGHLDVVRVLVSEFKADVNARTAGLSSHTHWECDTLISLPSHSHTLKRSFCNISHSFC